MSAFDFETWFETHVNIKSKDKKQFLKEWLQENDYETLEVLTFPPPIILPNDQIWATQGVQRAFDKAVSHLNQGFKIITVI